MKVRIFGSGILLILTIGIAFVVYAKATAQPDVISYLKERLSQQYVPVVEITILQQSPMQIQITTQSKSNGKKGTSEDPINYHLITREVSLASQQGYVIEKLTVVFLNTLGEQIDKSNQIINTQNILSAQLAKSTIDNDATKNLINEKINLYGMSITNMDISSQDGLQFLTLQLATPSLEQANQALPYFMPSLRPLLADVNTQGAQITVLKLELKDQQGNLLLNYMLDLQLKSENWWMADNLTSGWFPHPPSE